MPAGWNQAFSVSLLIQVAKKLRSVKKQFKASNRDVFGHIKIKEQIKSQFLDLEALLQSNHYTE